MAVTVDTTANPIIVTGTTATNDTITDERIFIKYVYWLNPTTAGHKVTLTDKNAKEIITLRCESANESQIVPLWTAWDGVHCTDMDSGDKLYILRS